MVQSSPIARIVSADKGTKSTVEPYERAMSRISTAVDREDHVRVPTRPRRSSEHSHTARKVAGGKGQESRAGVSIISPEKTLGQRGKCRWRVCRLFLAWTGKVRGGISLRWRIIGLRCARRDNGNILTLYYSKRQQPIISYFGQGMGLMFPLIRA